MFREGSDFLHLRKVSDLAPSVEGLELLWGMFHVECSRTMFHVEDCEGTERLEDWKIEKERKDWSEAPQARSGIHFADRPIVPGRISHYEMLDNFPLFKYSRPHVRPRYLSSLEPSTAPTSPEIVRGGPTLPDSNFGASWTLKTLDGTSWFYPRTQHGISISDPAPMPPRNLGEPSWLLTLCARREKIEPC